MPGQFWLQIQLQLGLLLGHLGPNVAELRRWNRPSSAEFGPTLANSGRICAGVLELGRSCHNIGNHRPKCLGRWLPILSPTWAGRPELDGVGSVSARPKSARIRPGLGVFGRMWVVRKMRSETGARGPDADEKSIGATRGFGGSGSCSTDADAGRQRLRRGHRFLAKRRWDEAFQKQRSRANKHGK